jgi:hypothetical protein
LLKFYRRSAPELALFKEEEMQPNISKNVNPAKEPVNSPEFHQMADGMKKAINEFESASSYMESIGDICANAWNATTRFVRRHPVESSIACGGLGLIAAYMLMSSRGSKIETT